MKKPPNIFDYATSELSQDAFLTWLIQWADKDYIKTDPDLNSCAISFVQELLKKNNSYKIESVQTGRQWKNVDVWALVNNQYFIVVEDKKGTKEHSNQLNRYSEIAKKQYNEKNIEVVLVYFKMEEQGKYTNIENAGYTVFQRSKMLSILENYIKSTEPAIQNNIIVDYYKNLESLDKKIKSYRVKPLDEWYWYSYQGFYSELKKHIGGNWEYVSNAAGGFIGFWWNLKQSKLNGNKFDYYLQIEENRLVFKLNVHNQNKRREIRDFFRKQLFKKAKDLDISISKFGRLGKSMGVAKLNTDYRVTNNNILDFDKTIAKLKNCMSLLNVTGLELEKFS